MHLDGTVLGQDALQRTPPACAFHKWGNQVPGGKEAWPASLASRSYPPSPASPTAQRAYAVTKAFLAVQKENLVKPFRAGWQADRSR